MGWHWLEGKWSRALLWTGGLAGIALVIGLFAFETRRNVALQYREEASSVEASFASVIDSFATAAQLIHEELVRDPVVMACLAAAARGPDEDRASARRRLWDRVQPLYRSLEDNGFRQFHFHQPGARSFLRMHRPEKYGDDLSTVRPSIVRAQAVGFPVMGFEEGRIFNGFRYVFPVSDDVGPLGSVEISISFDAIRPRLERVSPRRYTLALKRSVVETKVFGDEQHRYEALPLSDSLVVDEAVHRDIGWTTSDLSSSDRHRLEVAISAGNPMQIASVVDGEPRLLTMVPVKNIEDTVVAYVVSSRITDRVQRMWREFWWVAAGLALLGSIPLMLAHLILDRNREIRAAREAALEAARAKSRFLASMSHEIRTPLNGILGMSTLLRETRLTEPQRDYLETVRSSSEILLAVINDILDFSKAEAGRIELESSVFSPRARLDEVVSMFRESMAAKGLELTTHVDDSVPLAVRGDANRVGQILLNLVGNAVKFTEEGTVSIELTREGAERLRLKVRDSGIGIPRERLDALFNEFTQADASTTRRFGGTGLGLAICKRLAELMDGRIWVESRLGSGSTFYVDLRLEPADEAELSRRSSDLPEDPAGAPSLPSTARILVAEDNVVNQKVLLAMLHRLGLRADVARDGQEALEALARAEYDLLLCDIEMPNVDGHEVARELRDRPNRPHLVALTASVLEEDRHACFESGMDDFLAKPIVLRELEGGLRRWLIPRASGTPDASPSRAES